MGFLQFLGIRKARSYPKNLIGFDFIKVNQRHDNEYLENLRYNDLKKELSEKICKINRIKLFQLSYAQKVIREYQSLEKEIWG